MYTTDATVSVSTNMHDQSVSAYLAEHDLEFTPDGKFVRWQGKNKKHPRNWHIARKNLRYQSLLHIRYDCVGHHCCCCVKYECGLPRLLTPVYYLRTVLSIVGVSSCFP